jgi:hypothetical protein
MTAGGARPPEIVDVSDVAERALLGVLLWTRAESTRSVPGSRPMPSAIPRHVVYRTLHALRARQSVINAPSPTASPARTCRWRRRSRGPPTAPASGAHQEAAARDTHVDLEERELVVACLTLPQVREFAATMLRPEDFGHAHTAATSGLSATCTRRASRPTSCSSPPRSSDEAGERARPAGAGPRSSRCCERRRPHRGAARARWRCAPAGAGRAPTNHRAGLSG